jgi:hypothetical protein
MTKKLYFYQQYGVQEYYIFNPDNLDLHGLLRKEDQFIVIEEMNEWISPLLGIKFKLTEDNLEIYRPDGRKFLTSVEMEQRAEKAESRMKILEEKLREMGINPAQF